MSCTEYSKGSLRPTGKTFKHFVPDAENFWDADIEGFVEIDGQLFEIIEEKGLRDVYDPNIMNAYYSDKIIGGYDYEVMFYNGGCCLQEAIMNAVEGTPKRPTKEDYYEEFEEWFTVHSGYAKNVLEQLRIVDKFEYTSAHGLFLDAAFNGWKVGKGLDKLFKEK